MMRRRLRPWPKTVNNLTSDVLLPLHMLKALRGSITSREYLDIGLEASQVGARISVFLCARSPFILRPLKGRDCALVGDLFVLGIMYGEVRSMCDGRSLMLSVLY